MADAANPGLSDARLIFDGFVASPWRSLELRHGALHLTISRLGPAERAAADLCARAAPSSDDHSAETLLTAPHIATLRELAAIGSRVRAGEVYATLELLDDLIVLRAVQDMRPTSLLSQPGDLLQFGSPLMTMARVQGRGDAEPG